jgi:hypothetical protein
VAQEHLQFSLWYLMQKRYIQRSDNSQMVITIDGIDYLEEASEKIVRPRMLRAAATAH